MDHNEIDSFGILEPVETLPIAEPALESTTHHAKQFPELPSLASIIGTGNDTALRDVNKPKIDIGTLFVADGVVFEHLAQARSEKRAGRGLQDPDALQQLADRYVVPPGLLDKTLDGQSGRESSGDHSKTALEILRERRVLFLTCEVREGGQFTAALRLGYELQQRHPDLVVREELIDQLSADDLLITHEPAVVLSDLRHSTDDLTAVQRGLVDFAKALESHKSYLILIIPQNLKGTFDKLFPKRSHCLERPAATEVLAQHLTNIDAETLVRDSGLEEQLASWWPPEVKQLADVALARIQRGEDPEQVLREAMKNRRDGLVPSLRKAIQEKQEKPDVEWLALLLAATLLEGAAPEHIVDAANLMLARNRLAPKKTVPLLRPSPYTKLLHLDHPSFDFDTREFQPPGFGTQVLQHFWREHRHLQETLVLWIGDLPRQILDLTREELERIADRCAELAAEGGPDVALTLAAGWTTTKTGTASEGDETSEHRTARYRRSIAVRLLTTTATDPTLGKKTRQKLLEWSTGANADLQLLTAEVCAGIGQSFPRIALTRLKHLANSENKLVRSAVLASMQQISTDLGTSGFLRHLSEWFDKATPTRLGVMAESVSAVLDTGAEDVDAETAASFWRQAIDTMPPEELRPIAESWLRTAATASPSRRDGLVEALVRATGFDPHRIARVQYASRFNRRFPDTSALDVDPVVATVQQLWIRLDEVDPVWRYEDHR